MFPSPHQIQFQYKISPIIIGHWPCPLRSAASTGLHPTSTFLWISLHHPQHSGQRPEAMVKSYWSLEVAVHTGAVLPGAKGQSWVGQVRLNVPALLPGAMKVSSAQFILWPQLINSASPTSIELWFVITFFNSWPAHILPLKIGEWLYRCTCYSLGLILDGNHLDLQAGG